ncbi:anti-sigma factor antagonist [Rhodobacterales bacterium HKCCSP123]|nr:anti-sigma factor antagonist [Rhodobacterales bacterium HKCCSP123]
MKIEQTQIDGDIMMVTLKGDLDIAGTSDIEMPLSVIAGSRDRVILDMREVGFMASIGVRLIVSTAKPIARRGGTMVILGPNDAARRVLTSTGVDTLVPVVGDEAAARAAFG